MTLYDSLKLSKALSSAIAMQEQLNATFGIVSAMTASVDFSQFATAQQVASQISSIINPKTSSSIQHISSIVADSNPLIKNLYRTAGLASTLTFAQQPALMICNATLSLIHNEVLAHWLSTAKVDHAMDIIIRSTHGFPLDSASMPNTASLSSAIDDLTASEISEQILAQETPSDHLSDCVHTAATQSLAYAPEKSELHDKLTALVTASKSYLKDNILGILTILLALFQVILASIPNEQMEIMIQNQEILIAQNEKIIAQNENLLDSSETQSNLLKGLDDYAKHAVQTLCTLIATFDAIQDEIEVHENLTDLSCE